MKRKLAVFGLAFALAELAAATLPLSGLLPAAAVLLFAGLAVVTRRRKAVFLVTLGLALGFAWNMGYAFLHVRPVRALAGQTVLATATVETDATAAYQDGMLRGTLRLSELPGMEGEILVQCRNFPATQAGERFRAKFALIDLEENRYRMGNYADGVYLEAEYLGQYNALPASRDWRFRVYELRRALSARLRRWLPGVYGGVEAAMLLGDRRKLPASVTRSFRLAGVSHLLAVSGLHVSLLCGLFLPESKEDRNRRFSRPRILLRAGLVLLYMALTGFPVSVLRAGLAVLFVCLAYSIMQPPDYLTSMGAAALLLGLFNAYAPGDLGFQLSFSAVLGVQAASALVRWERKALPVPGNTLRAKLREVSFILAENIQVAALAALATLPVLLAHGMTASGVTVLTNLLVVWMLRPALLLGLLILALSALPLLAPCMRMTSLLLAVWLRTMLTVIDWCARLPAAQLYLPRGYTLWVLAVLGVLAAVLWWRRGRAWILPLCCLGTAAAVALGALFSRDVVTVSMVGTAGNACAVVTQNGQATVLFRGGASNLNAVEDYLAAHGGPAQTLLVDLRQQPQALAFAAADTLTMEDLTETETSIPLGGDMDLLLYHRSSGNLAVLDAGGIRVAIMAGNIRLSEPLTVDVYCAGGAYPQSIDADAILLNTAQPRWLDNVEEETVFYGSETPAVVVRPGRSIHFEEAKRLAVQ